MKKHVLFFVVIFLFLSVNLYKVISEVRPFYDWDESIYVQLGKEMVLHKSPVPLWEGKVWLDKPPLVPLIYGALTQLPVRAEITTRVVTVFLSAFALALIYLFAFRYSKSVLVALATSIITAYLPAFVQRTQVVNVDVFLLIGWFGYALWYKRPVVGTLFLLLGVLSKSLLGFYPVLMTGALETFRYIVSDKKGKNEYAVYLRTTAIQLLFAVSWFVWAYAVYRQDFIQYHFIDNQFKRVTASIEQHFGQRTFYLDLLLDQMKYSIIPAILSIVILGIVFVRTKSREAYMSLIFVPWFLFLNLTKTKIAWYLYPVLPQFVFLAVYLLRYVKNEWLKFGLFLAVLFVFFNFTGTPVNVFAKTDFSQWSPFHEIAIDAKNARCDKVHILVSANTRSSYETLKKMDLVIHTTTWWGDHPSMAYYAEIPTFYYYSLPEFENTLAQSESKDCFITETNDWQNGWNAYEIKHNSQFYLGMRP